VRFELTEQTRRSTRICAGSAHSLGEWIGGSTVTSKAA
jgi:hypothetical protein